MISRSVITESKDPKSDYLISLDWDANHPGSRITRFLNEFIMSRQNEEINELTSFEGYLLHIYWVPILQMGFVTVLQFTTERLIIDISTFCSIIWETIAKSQETSNEIKGLKDINGVNLQLEHNINLDWIKKSIIGGIIGFTVGDAKQSFVLRLTNIIYTFRWMFFSLDLGKISNSTIELHFLKSEKFVTHQFEDYLIKLVDPSNIIYHKLINRSLNSLLKDLPKDRMDIFISDLISINNILDTEIPEDERFKTLITSFSRFMILDSDLTKEQLMNLIISISKNENPRSDLIESMLHLSNQLMESKNEEMVQLVDGTVIEMILSPVIEVDYTCLKDISIRAAVIGGHYLVSFTQNLLSLKSKLELTNDLLKDIIGIIQNDLLQTWDGLMSLVELYNFIGEGNKAAKFRLEAVNTNEDQVTKAIDIFNALADIAVYDNFDEFELFEQIEKKFAFGMTHLPGGDVFDGQINLISKKLIENEKFILLDMIIDWIQQHIFEIGFADRLSLLKILASNMVNIEGLENHLIKLQLIQFNQYLDQNETSEDQSLLDQADRLLKIVFNGVDPEEPKFKEKLTIISQSLVLSATNYEEWELIQEALHRFNLLLNDETYYTKAVLQIYINAAKSRNKKSIDLLRSNDIGLRLFDEIIRLISKSPIDSLIAIEFLPDAKELANKVKDYRRYAIYTTLELNLNRITRKEWVNILVESAIQLINRNQIAIARSLFDNALKMNINEKEEYEILSRQLELAEKELDIVSVNEITEKRERMIYLATSGNKLAKSDEIINSYRNGISEILSKGSSPHLHTFLLNAIKFGVNNEIIDLTDFYNALSDSFNSYIENYIDNQSNETYSELAYVTRELVEIYRNTGKLPNFRFALKIISMNLDLYMRQEKPIFIHRALLVFREISVLFKQDHNYSNNDDINQLVDFANSIFSKNMIKHDDILYLDVLLGLGRFFISLNQSNRIISHYDRALNNIKKAIVRKKSPNSLLVAALLFVSDYYTLLDSYNIQEIQADLINKSIRLLNSVISLPKIDNSTIEQFQQLKERLQSDPASTLKEFKQHYFDYVQTIDKINRI